MSLFRKAKPDPVVAARALADDLDVLRDVLRHYPVGTHLTFGAPCRCPECGDYGLADDVNGATGVVHNTCRGCGRTWVITAQALRAYKRDPELRVPQLPELAAPALSVTWAPPDRNVDPAFMRPLDAETARFASTGKARPPEATPAPAPPVVTPTRPAHAPTPAHADVESAAAPPAHVAVEPASTEASAAEGAAEGAAKGAGASRYQAAHAADPDAVIELDRSTDAFVVLVVDDNPFDIALIEELIGHLSPDTIKVVHSPTLVAGLDAARFRSIDVAVIDLDLPDSSGLATMVEWQLQPNGAPPVVALVEHSDTELIRGARAAGARQVVQKRHLAQLRQDPAAGAPRLEHLLRTAAKPLVRVG